MQQHLSLVALAFGFSAWPAFAQEPPATDTPAHTAPQPAQAPPKPTESAAVPGTGSPQGGTLQGTPSRAGIAPAGLARERMWFAPTAEDWKRPCLIPWQRSWEDAQAVSRTTGKPLLVCVNMDGELASEHYAGVRYRQAEIAALYAPYVCVIASVYRHNPRDWDEQGRRILCPRFGSVTCGEHIALEPKLYAEFFDGQRVAPRHLAVEIDGAELYDVFYAWDTDTVFAALKHGVADRPLAPASPHGDRTLAERSTSRDGADRAALEDAYVQGERSERRHLIELTSADCEHLQLDVLRLAIRGFDVELAAAARAVLVRCASERTLDLIVDALRLPMEASEREALIAALARLGERSPRARTLATVNRGLAGRSETLDAERWSRALTTRPSAPSAPRERDELDARVAQSAAAVAAARAADAPESWAELAFAEAALELALDVRSARRYSDFAVTRHFAPLFLRDAQQSARAAAARGESGWTVESTAALAAYYLGERDEAARRAEAALRVVPEDPESWNSMAVIAIFGEARQRAIESALREQREWPAQWLADAHAAFSLLARHPRGSALQVANHVDFLLRLGAWSAAARALDVGLARFPDAAPLHDRLRRLTLEDKGLEGLEPVYAALLAAPGAAPELEWFAGYAAFVTAEFHQRGGRPDEALAAYDRAIEHYERLAVRKPDTRPNCDHYVALAFAGRARVALEREDFTGAIAQLLASLERKPEAAATLDGLNRSPIETARLLSAALKEQRLDTLSERLDEALAKLDPELVKRPDYER